MAADDDSSPGSRESEIPDWLGFLGLAGALGGLVCLACANEKQKDREAADLVDDIARLMTPEKGSPSKAGEELDRSATSASDEVSAKIEAQIEERVGRRLDAADARFNRRIDQISDSGASAVEQVLRETTRRSDEIIGEAKSRLEHIGWLGEEVAPTTDDSRRATTTDDDPVWADLGDFQRQFES